MCWFHRLFLPAMSNYQLFPSGRCGSSLRTAFQNLQKPGFVPGSFFAHFVWTASHEQRFAFEALVEACDLLGIAIVKQRRHIGA
jgi:hypothetical protein